MYRVLQSISGKNVEASFKAGAAMKKGMFVVKGTDGTVNFPAAATDKNVFIVGKELIATGADLLNPDLPDYSDVLENIAEGEYVTLEKPFAGEYYFDDQTTGTIGSYVLAGTDGKLVSSTDATKFAVIDSAYKDAGTHAGIKIEVLD